VRSRCSRELSNGWLTRRPPRSYNSTTQATFSFLDCISVGDQSLLHIAPSISCDGPAYRRLKPFFYFLLAAIVIGVPLLMVLGLWRWHVRGRQYDDEAAGPRHRFLDKWEQRFGILRQAYKPAFWCGRGPLANARACVRMRQC
jgi:hypothetical protein